MFHRAARLALGNPDRSRRWIPPGPGGLEAARRPHGRAVPLVVSLMVSLVVSLVVSLRVRSGEGNRARPGFSGRPGVPSGGRMGPGDGSRRDPGSGGGAAASEPSSAISGITNGIISGIISGITKGVDGGRRSGAPEFLRAAPWERASPGPGSRGQPQNPILEHKARFYGVSVIFADPQNTSRAQMAEARPIPEGPESPRRSPQPRRATALVAALVTVLVAVFYGGPRGWRGRARELGGPGRWRRHLRPRDRAWPGSVSLDPTRAFPGDSPADPGSLLQCKAGESTAGRPGLNRGFPGIPAKGRGRKAPSGRGGRIRVASPGIPRETPGDGPGARAPSTPLARGARVRHEGGVGSKKAKGTRSGVPLRGEDEPPRGGRPVFLGPGVSGNLPGRRIGAGRERPDGTPRRCGRRPDPEGPSRRSPGFPERKARERRT
jgi:hypothetical protein